MAIFQITPLGDNMIQLSHAVGQHFPGGASYRLQNDMGWLVVFAGTTVELSEVLGIVNPDRTAPSTVGSTLIVSLTAYYGRGPTDMWEWLKTRMEAE